MAPTALTQTVTIINNSGKIISTGRQLAGIFKEARASYQDKKASIKADRELRRAQTFDVSSPRDLPPEAFERRLSYDDGQSVASSRRSYRSRRSHHPDEQYYPPSRPALTENNLKTHSEVSSVTPSRAPPAAAYRSPYAETAPRDMALSRPALQHYTTAPTCTDSLADSATIRGANYIPRTMSSPAVPTGGKKKTKEIDMDLAYGNIPPDLAQRTDLDPKEDQAKDLVSRVEGLLEEAHCIQHSATATIAHLQKNPDAAAAVALTLAELSTLLKSMSPAFLSVIKGGSPAVFALLASPQFLIAAGATLGMTVVMFGGWKIVKQIKDAKAQRDAIMANAIAMEAQPAALPPPTEYAYEQYDPYAPPPPREGSIAYDEAVILDERLEEELSSIETWRRGIAPLGEDESVDMELISPEAARSIRGDPDTRTERSFRTTRSSKTHRSSRTDKSHRSHRSSASMRESEIPERKSSIARSERGGDAESIASSHRSYRSSASKRTGRVSMLTIEEGRSEKDDEVIEIAARPKKNNMLRSLFKKKEKEHRERDERVSALVF